MSETATTEAPAPAATEAKSIVSAKYRNKYKGATRDWLAQYLFDNATKTKDVTVTKPSADNPDEKVTTTEKRPDGIDTGVLLTLCDANGGQKVTDKLRGHESDHGFAGRCRMTIGNVLRRVAGERHGIVGVDGNFVPAPTAFLTQIGAGEKPTHNPDGSKIAVATTTPASPPPAPAVEESAPSATAAPDKPKGGKKA